MKRMGALCRAPRKDTKAMANWIDKQYPVGQEVEVLGDGSGVISNHTEEANYDKPGMHTAGIIVQLDAGGWTEVEASFLNEDGSSGPYVVKK